MSKWEPHTVITDDSDPAPVAALAASPECSTSRGRTVAAVGSQSSPRSRHTANGRTVALIGPGGLDAGPHTSIDIAFP